MLVQRFNNSWDHTLGLENLAQIIPAENLNTYIADKTVTLFLEHIPILQTCNYKILLKAANRQPPMPTLPILFKTLVGDPLVYLGTEKIACTVKFLSLTPQYHPLMPLYFFLSRRGPQSISTP